MASNKTEIANLALSHLGVGTDIDSLDTDDSAEAKACRRFYETSKDEILRLAPWPFATKFATLSLITDFNDDDHETDEWDYVYQYPSDCVFLRRILSGNRKDTNTSDVEFKIVHNEVGSRIYTDMEEAEVEYTVRATNVEKWPADFAMALSFRLAAYIAPRVTGGDPYKMSDRVLKFYTLSHSIAAANAFNEEHNSREPETDLVRSRD